MNTLIIFKPNSELINHLDLNSIFINLGYELVTKNVFLIRDSAEKVERDVKKFILKYEDIQEIVGVVKVVEVVSISEF